MKLRDKLFGATLMSIVSMLGASPQQTKASPKTVTPSFAKLSVTEMATTRGGWFDCDRSTDCFLLCTPLPDDNESYILLSQLYNTCSTTNVLLCQNDKTIYCTRRLYSGLSCGAGNLISTDTLGKPHCS